MQKAGTSGVDPCRQKGDKAMKTSQVLRDLEQGKEQGKEFIKWWRKENDFADFELIDHYLETLSTRRDVENFELLDKEEMWKILKRWIPNGLRRSKSTQADRIEWQHLSKDGQIHTYTCPYNAHSIMSIFDAETKGDTLV
jgi:hypothetical protein